MRGAIDRQRDAMRLSAAMDEADHALEMVDLLGAVRRLLLLMSFALCFSTGMNAYLVGRLFGWW